MRMFALDFRPYQTAFENLFKGLNREAVLKLCLGIWFFFFHVYGEKNLKQTSSKLKATPRPPIIANVVPVYIHLLCLRSKIINIVTIPSMF